MIIETKFQAEGNDMKSYLLYNESHKLYTNIGFVYILKIYIYKGYVCVYLYMRIAYKIKFKVLIIMIFFFIREIMSHLYNVFIMLFEMLILNNFNFNYNANFNLHL